MFSFSFLLAIIVASTKAMDAPAPVADTSSLGVNKTVLLQLVNAARKKGCQCGDTYYPSAPPVKWNDKLQLAAQNHSKDMEQNRYFSHTNKKGQSAGKRINEAGYKFWGYGENIAQGYGSEASVIQGWLKSPGHCSNIMTKAYSEMGVGRSGSYWTQVMATGK